MKPIELDEREVSLNKPPGSSREVTFHWIVIASIVAGVAGALELLGTFALPDSTHTDLVVIGPIGLLAVAAVVLAWRAGARPLGSLLVGIYLFTMSYVAYAVYFILLLIVFAVVRGETPG